MTHVDTGLRSDHQGRIWVKTDVDPSMRVFVTIVGQLEPYMLMRLDEGSDTHFFAAPPYAPLVDALTRIGLPTSQPATGHFRPTIARPRSSCGALSLTRATPLFDSSGTASAELTLKYTHCAEEFTLLWQPLPNDDAMLPYRLFMRDIAIPPNRDFKFKL